MVNLFDTSEDWSFFSDDEAIEDGDDIEDESEAVSLPDSSESEEEVEEEPQREWYELPHIREVDRSWDEEIALGSDASWSCNDHFYSDYSDD
ncbi:hypothetical protein LTR84_011342 [Exophiala bonariae]|uniref:Uncharacterized protein n=1 Tax=Exophiala bonariae TaxID=1690606 RepID=A0AAV9MUQ2_9EURO|nr:hypothetical protein LTR84_011342 [Exophiala bonariae]